MSAPKIVKVVPDVDERDVVLGQAISVYFDQEIDPTSLDEDTFSLSCPSPTQVVSGNQLISGDSPPSSLAVEGTWSFILDSSGHSVATFQPRFGFRPNTVYSAIILGADASLSTEDLHNMAGIALAESYTWSFTTGDLNLKTPPVTSPLLDEQPPIQPGDIHIVPRLGTTSQSFDIIFPEDIDPTSFDVNDMLVSIEPVLGNPMIAVPSGLAFTAVVTGRKVTVTITSASS